MEPRGNESNGVRAFDVRDPVSPTGDAFAADADACAREIGLSENHSAAFLRLVPTDLEFQARVLLRKRFKLVVDALPQTCCRLGPEAWTEFQRYGRSSAPAQMEQVCHDVLAFAEYLCALRCGVCPLELNRARFTCRRRTLVVHLVIAIPAGGRRRPCVQILLRSQSQRWQEWLLYPSLGRAMPHAALAACCVTKKSLARRRIP